MARYGHSIKSMIDKSHEKMKNWAELDWQASEKEFDTICKELTNLLIKKFRTDDPKVQAVIQRHYD